MSDKLQLVGSLDDKVKFVGHLVYAYGQAACATDFDDQPALSET